MKCRIMTRFSRLSNEGRVVMSDRMVEAQLAPTRVLIRERKDFMRDRYLNGRIRYMAHADGWVMCRRPRAVPMVMQESAWRQLPYLGQ